MKCSICKSELVKGKEEVFETLEDHVCRPDDEPPSRSTLICPDVNCLAHKYEMFWDEWGGWYSGSHAWKELEEAFVAGLGDAFESSSRALSAQSAYREKRIYIVQSPWLDIRLERNADADENGILNNVLFHRLGFSFWIGKDESSKHLYLSGWSMFLFNIDCFHRAHQSYLKNPHNKYVKQELLDCFNKNGDEWHRREWWRTASHYFLNNFYSDVRDCLVATMHNEEILQ